MTLTFEQAKRNLEALCAANPASGQGRNEATTRLQIIDGLLTECLGWPREEIVAEDRFEDNSYADYVLGRPARKVVVEAKREDHYFTVPAGFDQRTCRLATLFDGNPTLKAAVEQVVGYAGTRGLGIAAVSNGHQLVVLLASRTDGVAPLEGRALVFTSLQDMLEGFRDLWDNLSPAGVDLRNAQVTLREDIADRPPEKLSATIHDFPGFRLRDEEQLDLRNLGELFLQDLAESPDIADEFLEFTYCTSGALSQYAMIGKELLKARYSLLLDKEAHVATAPAAVRDGISDELKQEILTSSLSRRPIVLLGDVGVGKTMFIKRLISVEAKEILRERSIVLYVDYGSEPALPGDLTEFTSSSLIEQLLETYGIDIYSLSFVQAVHHGELLRFENSVEGMLKDVDEVAWAKAKVEFLSAKTRDVEGHLKASLEYLVKNPVRQVVICLDNIDQRDEEFQDRVYIISQAMAENWPATVFVALRPKTFHMSRKKGSLAAYQVRVFTISPPRVDLVIQRRVEFALQQLETHGRLPWFPEGVTFQVGTLELFLQALVYSFTENRGLFELIDNLSGGNVRRALDFVGAFVGSGHIDTQRILRIMGEKGEYTINVHEFLRAILFGDNEYYDPTSSAVVNVFDVSGTRALEHFLLPIILCHVLVRTDQSSEEGFVSLDDVFEVAQGLGYDEAQIRTALERAFDGKLLEMTPRFDGAASATRCRITTVGAYTVGPLIRLFTYLDAISTDTPILDPAFRARIWRVSTLEARIERAQIVRAYLDSCWAPLADRGAPFDWPEVSAELEADMVDLARRIGINRSAREKG